MLISHKMYRKVDHSVQPVLQWIHNCGWKNASLSIEGLFYPLLIKYNKDYSYHILSRTAISSNIRIVSKYAQLFHHESALKPSFVQGKKDLYSQYSMQDDGPTCVGPEWGIMAYWAPGAGLYTSSGNIIG